MTQNVLLYLVKIVGPTNIQTHILTFQHLEAMSLKETLLEKHILLNLSSYVNLENTN